MLNGDLLTGYKLNKDYLTGGVLKKRQPPFFCPRKGRRKMSKKAGTALSVMAMVFMGAGQSGNPESAVCRGYPYGQRKIPDRKSVV